MDSLCLHGQTGLLGPTCWLAPPRPLRIPARHMSHARVSRVFPGCYTARNERGGRYLEMSRTIARPEKQLTERRMMIDTVAWVHLENGRILCARPRGKGVFYVPGGKREGAESDLQTLLREIAEELAVALRPETVRHAGTYQADHPDGTAVRMSCYTGEYSGTLAASSEIDELAWFGYADRARVPPVDQLLFDDLNAAGQLR